MRHKSPDARYGVFLSALQRQMMIAVMEQRLSYHKDQCKSAQDDPIRDDSDVLLKLHTAPLENGRYHLSLNNLDELAWLFSALRARWMQYKQAQDLTQEEAQALRTGMNELIASRGKKARSPSRSAGSER